MLFDKLTELTREYECWTYIKPHARATNGRAAYMAFKNHYLGPNNIGNMVATAEHKLINATYRGEARCWYFERYAPLHKEQHTIDTIPTRNGRELGEIWVSKVGTNF